MQYEHITDGASFEAFVFKDFVVKVPKKRKHWSNERMDQMIEVQNMLSAVVDGVLPCYRFGDVLVAPKAPGKRLDKIEKSDRMEKKEHIKSLRAKILSEIEEHGYILKDVGSRNIFYDEETDKIYLYDFNNIVEKPQEGEDP